MSDSPLVLLVEDEDSIRLTLRDYLERHGYKVLVASDGVGAIKLLVDHDVSVIVTDFRMELFGGDYWIRFLQKYCPGMPVFVMSGFLDSEFDLPYPCFTKPFDYGALEQRIKETIFGTG